MNKVKVGLLPLYIKLYDISLPHMRSGVNTFLNEVKAALEGEGVDPVTSEICCEKEQFAAAVKMFEESGAACIVTLHLAYSPSLESAEALAESKLPIIVLDTTPQYCFDASTASEAILYNHGIHGVQDLCSVLKRLGKDYEIFAGHFTQSDVIKRAADCAKAIAAAESLNGMKVGLIGKPFEGMGDFAADDDALSRLGVIVKKCDGSELDELCESVTEEEIRAEFEKDSKQFELVGLDFSAYAPTEKVALAVRKWIKKHGLGAFTINFQSAGSLKGLATMPFAVAGKQMAAGTGYAGEGDVLTAALVGSLLSQFEETGFAEMFCPDWEGGSVFLSHMGEANPRLLKNRQLMIKPFPYADAFDPVFMSGVHKPGRACIVNIAPCGDGYFSMVLAAGEMLDVDTRGTRFEDSICGWFKPDTPLEVFLEKFSRAGGTHHSAVVYGVSPAALEAYARALGMKCSVI